MPKRGYRFTAPQRDNLRRGHLGQIAWNKGTGGCRRGHDPALYVTPPSGVAICLGCKRQAGARYREKNKAAIHFKGRLARYGISAHLFAALWEAQTGQCAICHAELHPEKYRIDHDHQTGAVRGILCTSCNAGLGLLKDSVEVLMQAAQYLTVPPVRGLDGDHLRQQEAAAVPQRELFAPDR
jgi:Recombination endonuclease VII